MYIRTYIHTICIHTDVHIRTYYTRTPSPTKRQTDTHTLPPPHIIIHTHHIKSTYTYMCMYIHTYVCILHSHSLPHSPVPRGSKAQGGLGHTRLSWQSCRADRTQPKVPSPPPIRILTFFSFRNTYNLHRMCT